MSAWEAAEMSLGIDLTGSRAKLVRAERLIESLDDRIAAMFRDNALPFDVTTERDEDTDIVRWFLVNRPDADLPEIALTVGEVVYNLRCALDYIVTEMVQQSGSPVTRGHQFPVYLTAEKYHKAVSPVDGSDLARGPLANVRIGLDIFAAAQPFNQDGPPDMTTLWHLQQISNADKHRQMLATHPMPSGGDIELLAKGPMRPVPLRPAERPWDFRRRDNKTEVLALELGPFSQVKPRFGINAQIMFLMESIDPEDPRPTAFNMSNLRDSVLLVDGLLDEFEQL